MNDYLNQLTCLPSFFGHQRGELPALPEQLRLPSKKLVAFSQPIYYRQKYVLTLCVILSTDLLLWFDWFGIFDKANLNASSIIFFSKIASGFLFSTLFAKDL